MRTGIDILENEIVAQYLSVLEILLGDHTTQANIFWGTKNYEHLGGAYSTDSYISPELITRKNGNIIMPRVHKNKTLQRYRSKEMPEVFTHSWICNVQNILIDTWFGKEWVFNHESTKRNGTKSWKVNPPIRKGIWSILFLFSPKKKSTHVRVSFLFKYLLKIKNKIPHNNQAGKVTKDKNISNCIDIK